MNNESNSTTLKLEIPVGKYCFSYGVEAAEDMALCRCFSNDNGVPTCGAGFHNLSDDGTGIMKSPTCVALSEKSKRTPSGPQFKHDCEGCVFLGRLDQYDLYYHPEDAGGVETLIVRYSDGNPDDCNSGMIFSHPPSKKSRHPTLLIARILAETKGYRVSNL